MCRKGSPPRTDDLATPLAVIDRPPKHKRYPGGLARVVSGMFYNAVANRRQPELQYIYSVGGVNLIVLFGGSIEVPNTLSKG